MASPDFRGNKPSDNWDFNPEHFKSGNERLLALYTKLQKDTSAYLQKCELEKRNSIEALSPEAQLEWAKKAICNAITSIYTVGHFVLTDKIPSESDKSYDERQEELLTGYMHCFAHVAEYLGNIFAYQISAYKEKTKTVEVDALKELYDK